MLEYIGLVLCLFNCGGYVILEKPCEMCAAQEMHGHVCKQCAVILRMMVLLSDEAEKAAAVPVRGYAEIKAHRGSRLLAMCIAYDRGHWLYWSDFRFDPRAAEWQVSGVEAVEWARKL